MGCLTQKRVQWGYTAQKLWICARRLAATLNDGWSSAAVSNHALAQED